MRDKAMRRHLPPSHAHLLAHLVSEAFLPITQVLPVLFSQFVSTVRTVGIPMMVSLFLGSVLTVALSPLGLIFASHELVELIVVSLSFPLLIFPAVIFVSLPAPMLLSLLFVALRLTSSGQRRDCKTHSQDVDAAKNVSTCKGLLFLWFL